MGRFHDRLMAARGNQSNVVANCQPEASCQSIPEQNSVLTLEAFK